MEIKNVFINELENLYYDTGVYIKGEFEIQADDDVIKYKFNNETKQYEEIS